MKFLLILATAAGLNAQTCGQPYLNTTCPNPLAASGVISGSSPSVTALFSQPYSANYNLVWSINNGILSKISVTGTTATMSRVDGKVPAYGTSLVIVSGATGICAGLNGSYAATTTWGQFPTSVTSGTTCNNAGLTVTIQPAVLDEYNLVSRGLNTTDPIDVYIHGGGGSTGDKSDESSVFTALSGTLTGMAQQLGHTEFSLNYPLTNINAGLGAYNPLQVQALICGLHSIAHFAGILWPGNAMDIRPLGYSWGTLLIYMATVAPNAYAANCEYTDPFQIRLSYGFATVYDLSTAYNAANSNIVVAVNQYLQSGGVPCSTPSTCAADGMVAAAPRNYFALTNPRITMLDGTGDLITVPAQQLQEWISDMAAAGGYADAIVLSGVSAGGGGVHDNL